MYCVHVEPLIFAGAISASHAVVVPVAMFISIASWLAVCFSDPGVVDAHTLDAQLATYPHDHVLYKPKTCPTLGVTCPARSKYCRVTQRRVAKFDHCCGWMGNSIGENNLRYFVTFLAVHVVLTSYGSWLCASAISGEIGRRGLWSAEFEPTRRKRGGGAATWRLAFGFGLELAHEIRRVPLLARGDAFSVPRDPRGDAGCVPGVPPVVDSKGVTTNESFKWADYERFLRRTAERRRGRRRTTRSPSWSKTEEPRRSRLTTTGTSGAWDHPRRKVTVAAAAVTGEPRRRRGNPLRRSLLALAFGFGKPKLEVMFLGTSVARASFLLNLKDVFVPPSRAHMRRLELGVSDKKRQ